MSPTFPRFIHIAAMASTFAVAGCAHHHHHGGHGGPGHSHLDGEGLSVLGTGEAKAQPDVARTSIGIEVRADTAEQATAQANEHMTAILNALRAAGVADTDVRTHDFSVSFERDFTPPQPVLAVPAPKPAPSTKAAPAAAVPPPSNAPRGSYRVSNTVEVTVHDVSKVSAVLTAATNAGANNIWGVNFDLQNPDPLHEKAREQAITRAKHSAEELAKLTGVKLGAIVTIEDQADQGQIAPRIYRAALAESSDGSQVPVQGGELVITHQVRLVYALDKP